MYVLPLWHSAIARKNYRS